MKKKILKVFLSSGSEFACSSNCLVLKDVRAKVSLHFRLENY